MSARAAPMSTSAGSSCAAQESTGGSSSGNNSLEQKTALYIAYPINSVVELTLSPNAEVVRGVVYTTDEISNSVVLKKSLPHSNLTSEIRIVNAAAVTEKKILNSGPGGNTEGAGSSRQNGENGDISDCIPEELTAPLPAVSKKSLEERERRAIRLAEESFHHINQKASPFGQAVFDRLVKACNEVVWRGESIIVLNHIRVDPPYAKQDCKLLTGTGEGGSLNEGSLDRVKMIVASTTLG